MTGLTPIYSIPYPDGLDTLAELPGILEDQAEQVESTIAGFGGIASPGSWTAPTFGSNWTNLGGLTPVKYRKVGVEVMLRGYIEATADQAADAAMFTLPSGFRPLNSESFACDGTPGHVRIDVTSAGKVSAPTYAVPNTGFVCLSGVRFYID